MTFRAKRWTLTVARPALAVLCLGTMLVGCGGQTPAPQETEQPKPPALSIPTAAPSPAAQAPTASQSPGSPQTPSASKSTRSFEEATLSDVPGQSLPEKTKTGKSVGKLYEQVAAPGGEWDKVQFTTPGGKKLAYTAIVKTELGVIKIDLWPDVAPNHVRNFVALARVGYYDGLEFDRTAREEYKLDEDGSQHIFEVLEAGCPLGTGDPSYGSIGYWLKPELNEKLEHAEGTVGAWHAEELETAACKFYITLTKAPWMDFAHGGRWTVFGKIAQGLEVARTILMRPVRNEDDQDRPVSPVVIQSVTIEARAIP